MLLVLLEEITPFCTHFVGLHVSEGLGAYSCLGKGLPAVLPQPPPCEAGALIWGVGQVHSGQLRGEMVRKA